MTHYFEITKMEGKHGGSVVRANSSQIKLEQRLLPESAYAASDTRSRSPSRTDADVT